MKSSVCFGGSVPANSKEFAPRIVVEFGKFRVIEEWDGEDGGSLRYLESAVLDHMGQRAWTTVEYIPESMPSLLCPLLEALRELCRGAADG